MGLFSNQISRDDLKAGDHIYTWRTAYTYSHHGIYVGNGEVIHFTRGGGLETGTGTYLDKIIVSSVPNHGGDNPCPNCEDQSNLGGVISSCLDCFLAGGNLYLFEYGVTPAYFMAKPRGGTCTTAPSDPSPKVISRATFLFLRKGFGAYHLLENNCEDFAIFCKTGLVVLSKLGGSGQAHSVSAARDVLQKTFSVLGAARYFIPSTVGFAVTGFGGMAEGYGKYCIGRLNSDIGVRKDVTKVPVERLAEVVALIQGNLENKNKCKIS